jgi:hypothetical protein
MKTDTRIYDPVTTLKFPTSPEVLEPNAGLYRKQRGVVVACATALGLLVAAGIVSAVFPKEAKYLFQMTLMVLIISAYKFFPRWKKTVDEVHPILHVSANSIAAVSSRNTIEFVWDKLDYIEPWFVDEQPALRFGTGDEAFYAPESMPNYAWFNSLVFQLVNTSAENREAILRNSPQPGSELPPPQEHWRRIPYVKFGGTYGE